MISMTRRRLAAVAGAAGVLAALVWVFALGGIAPASDAPAANRPASCDPPMLRFRGVQYRARLRAPSKLGEGRRLGRAVRTQACTRSRRPSMRRVDVFGVTGVDPRVAISDKRARGAVWVATDRCRTARSTADVRRCLRASAQPESADPGLPPRPPPAFLTASSGETKLAFGSSCWSSEGHAACISMVPPHMRNDIPTVVVTRGEVVRFRLGFTPRSLELHVERGSGPGEVFELEPAQSVEWRVPETFAAPRPGVVVVLDARSVLDHAAGGGSASYVVRLVSA